MPDTFQIEHPDLKVHYVPDDFLKRMDAVDALNELGCHVTYESLSRRQKAVMDEKAEAQRKKGRELTPENAALLAETGL